MSKRLRTLIGLATGLVAVLVLVTPNVSHAASTCVGWSGVDLSTCAFTLFQWLAFIIAYIVSIISVIVFSIESFALTQALNINFTIVNNPAVQVGFSIVLAFANILFVAAVIIMAVATIVRYDAYGAKQMLWKIVIAAIGVNFSLILAGTVILFSDQLSKFFIHNATPNTGNTLNSAALDTHAFVSNLAGAFNPQQLYAIDTNATSTQATLDKAGGTSDNAADLGGIIAALVGILMTAGMGIMMAIFMGVLVAAFFVRIIVLSLLLTIMPAVWIAWVFPFGRPLVSYWRNMFIKWVFFAPLSLFFLYLSLKALAAFKQMGVFNDVTLADKPSATTEASLQGLGTFVATTLQELAGPLIQNIVKFSLTVGTLWGGLYLSSKLGIKAAGVGADAMKSVGKSAQRAVTTRMKNTSTTFANRNLDRLRTVGAKNDPKGKSFLQKTGSRFSEAASNSRIARYAGVGTVGRAMTNLGVPDKKSGDERKDYHKKSLKNLSSDALNAELERLRRGTLMQDPDREAAILDILKDNKDLGDINKRFKDKVVEPELAKWREQNKDATADEEAAKRKQLEQDSAEGKQLKEQLKRQSIRGSLKDILEAAPQLAKFAPLGKTKDAARRELSTEEAVAVAISGTKGDNIANIAFDPELFGQIGAKEDENPSIEQILNTTALTNEQVKKIGDINLDSAAAIQRTLEKVEKWKIEKDEIEGRQGIDDAEKGRLKSASKYSKFYEVFVDTRGPDGKVFKDDQIPEITANQLATESAMLKINSKLSVLRRSVNLVKRAKQGEKSEAEKQTDREDAEDERLGTGQAGNTPPPASPNRPVQPMINPISGN